jgi:pteridine reductase
MKLQGAVALVTGGARRVGREICLELARGGADVVVHYHRSAADAESLRRELEAAGRRCWLLCADLADIAAVEALLRQIGELAHVDIVINSASVFWRTPLEEVSVDQFDATVDVNLRAPFFIARELGLKMRAHGFGKIINIADAAIRRPYRNYAPYLISKAGIAALTETLALELAPEVQVNTVAPGTVLMPEDASAGMRDAIVRRTPLKRIGSPGDVAAIVRHLVENGDFTTGGFFAVDGGAGL